MSIHKNQSKQENGFTVVEIIVAVVLLSLTVISLISMVTSAQYAQRDAYYLGEANRAAQTKIQQMQAGPFSSATNGTTDFSSDSSLSKLPSNKSAEMVISTSALAPDSKQIDVTIKYTMGSVEKKVKMTAYIDP